MTRVTGLFHTVSLARDTSQRPVGSPCESERSLWTAAFAYPDERRRQGDRREVERTLRRKQEPNSTVTLETGDEAPAQDRQRAEADLATAATLSAREVGGARPTPAKVNPAEVATLSLENAGASPGELALGTFGDEPAPIPSRLSALPPALAERFESPTFLGEGGMGAVYRARDRRLDRDVALKFLFGGGPETNEKLLREARSQARLEHENACKVYEAGVDGGHRYIVMQLIDGEPLDDAAERMTLEEKVRAVRQIASALHEAHRLGLVHRDIKPGNILVEEGKDGAYKPYLMDFGLAREVGEHRPSVTKGIAGTPAYMAPEQAMGDTRSLDRRTDVYSLGATLYDIVGGRPPFVDENLYRLLQRVAREDPAPLKKVLPGVPEDVDAIVMKCLEKEPGRRYESARALGDDLQRFLDGEPVQARRAGAGYVLLKKLRRHKAKVAAVGAALVATLAFVVMWAKDRQLASQRAEISRELGEDVKEMELFLRNAYGLPLHDVERERDVVRARLRGVEERMAALGPAGEGPGHYAIGRGLLALREPERAIVHLSKASAAGYSPPELDYARGLALGELYRKALEATRRIENAEQKRAKIAAIEAEYKEPALRHLRAALGARLEVPAYVEGLIALYEGKNDEALAKAEEAYSKAPWLPDAKKLTGDAHFAEGSRFRPDAAFDRERMMAHYGRAAEAYRAAAEMASSDPVVHLAECELWIQVMNGSEAAPGSLIESFEKARAACERGVAASPRWGAARVKTAFAYQVLAWQAQQLPPGGQDPVKVIEEAIARAEEAARASPEDPMAAYLLGAAWRTHILYFLNRGIESGAAIERAVTAYERAIDLEPTFLWAHNELCWAHAMRAHEERDRGLDPSASVRKAVERCDRASTVDPSFTLVHGNKALALYYLAKHEVDHGRSPDAAVKDALSAITLAREKSPESAMAINMAGWMYLVKANHESDKGVDPAASLALAEESAREFEKVAAGTIAADEIRGMIALARALHLLREGGDPREQLAGARAAVQRLVDDTPWDIDYRILRAQVEILEARWALDEGRTEDAPLGDATRALEPALDRERAHPWLYRTVAEIHELRAARLIGERKDAAAEIARGLEMAGKALARNPDMAAALAVKGALLVLEARTARDPSAALSAARRAKEALSAAARSNPLITRDRGAILAEAARLSGEVGER
jgi:eukaryotic-like serine/threonine-protein kinase